MQTAAGCEEIDLATIKRLILSLFCHGLISAESVIYLFREFLELKNA